MIHDTMKIPRTVIIIFFNIIYTELRTEFIWLIRLKFIYWVLIHVNLWISIKLYSEVSPGFYIRNIVNEWKVDYKKMQSVKKEWNEE